VEAEEFAGFGGRDAGVGGEAVEVVEALAGGVRRQSGFAELRETFLETFEDCASVGIAWRNRTTRAGIAALELNITNGEAHGVALVGREELIFPEGRDAVDFESGAETEADVVWGERKPLGDGAERGAGNDGWPVRDGVVGKAAGRIANDNLLLKENAEPFGGVFVVFGEGERASGNFAAIGWHGKGDGTKIGGVVGADVVNEGSALAIDPFAVDGIEGPGAIESESTRWGDAGLEDRDGIQGFDGMQTDVLEGRRQGLGRHGESLAGSGGDFIWLRQLFPCVSGPGDLPGFLFF
jgi:hypothetical protein